MKRQTNKQSKNKSEEQRKYSGIPTKHMFLWGFLFCLIVCAISFFIWGVYTKDVNHHVSTYLYLFLLLLVIVIYTLYYLLRKRKKTDKESKDKEKVDASRRKFLMLSSSFAQNSAIGEVQQKLTDSIAAVTKKTNPKSKNPIIPAGAVDFQRYKQQCNVCQACVQACPQHILKPSLAYEHLMLPILNFKHGGCPIDCVKCNEACPTGALDKISTEDKTDIQIGYAVWLRENCTVIQDHPCSSCEKACPNGSIQMIQSGRFQIPIINTGRCLGCGACEAACPASPLKAIYVEGHKVHRQS